MSTSGNSANLVRAVDVATADPGVGRGLGIHRRVAAAGRRSRHREYQTARIGLLPVLRVHLERRAELLQVGEAIGPPRRFARTGEYGEEDRRENSNDRDDHEQLDEGETGLSFTLQDNLLSDRAPAGSIPVQPVCPGKPAALGPQLP